MSYADYSYNVNNGGQYHPLDHAMQPSAFDGEHHYNFPDEPNPYPSPGHISTHQPVSRYQFQDIRNDFDRNPRLHSIPSHNYADPPEWPPFHQKPCRTFPTPAHVYEHFRNTSDALNLQLDMESLNFPRATLAGSLDPATGIFYRTPEHPRLRTAQACEKCRTRKAKCSGEHPACKRCINRNLVCEYAKEGRIRGPNKPKLKAVGSREEFPGGEIQPNISRDGTPTHLATSSPGAVASDQMVAVGAIKGEMSNDHLPSSSFSEHRPLQSRPSNLRIGHRGSPSASLRRPRQENYGTLYSTTPLQSPISPAFDAALDATTAHHTSTSFSQMSPHSPEGQHCPAPTRDHAYSEQPVPALARGMDPNVGNMFAELRHPTHYSTASTHFDYQTEFPDTTADIPSTYQGAQPLTGASSNLFPAFGQSTQQFVGASSHWSSQSNSFPQM